MEVRTACCSEAVRGSAEVARLVRKRGGSFQIFDAAKIGRAVLKAFGDTDEDPYPVPQVVAAVLRAVPDHGVVHVEDIQDVVERVLMDFGMHRPAKSYILWREDRSRARAVRRSMDKSAIEDYIHPAKYARFRNDLGRRELFHETVDRVKGMHIRRFPEHENLIERAFEFVYAKRVLPSMRSLQFGSTPIERTNVRIYNCLMGLIDRPRAFAEFFYLLLCGCGVGFSVQRRHVDELPSLGTVDRRDVRHHVTQDSIEGWADALDELVRGYVEGYYVEFSYHLVRPEGAPLVTTGGRAPGHLPLKKALDGVRDVLAGAQGRRLRPIECYDILCLASNAVLAGGIRRSASIALFDVDDDEMMTAKTGEWLQTHPWRGRANNSAVLHRPTVTYEQFSSLFECTKQWGEPAFYFTDDCDYVCNPCGEIVGHPVLHVGPEEKKYLEDKGVSAPLGASVTGWSVCNLSEINAARFADRESMLEAARAAATIGTLQASYTSFPYLGPVSELISRRDALLGVSMTGMMDCPDIAFDPANQRAAAAEVVRVNREVAEKIGISPGARLTCTKPSGTASLALGCVGSGIHPHHSRRYFRRIIANRLERVYEFFREHNPHMCSRLSDTDDIITFCVEAPESAITVEELTALEFLDKVASTQQNWVVSGTARPDVSPGARHNVSNTVVVREHEWEDVKAFLWDRRGLFTGVSLLAATGDKDYPNAPREAVKTQQDEHHWNYLVANYTSVDYTEMHESEDHTDLQGEIACGGGACTL